MVAVEADVLVSAVVTTSGGVEMLGKTVGLSVVWTVAPRIGVDVAVVTDAITTTVGVDVGATVRVLFGVSVGVLVAVLVAVSNGMGIGDIPTDALRTGALPTRVSRDALDSRMK